MGSVSAGLSPVALTIPRHIGRALGVAIVLLAAAAYLRDPPWLLSMTSGMRAWQTDSTGARFRWMGGHASFFVPADAQSIEIPVRTTFDRPGDWPITASMTIDDRAVNRVVLSDAEWHRVVLTMPPRGSRNVRRIDVRMDHTRDDNRAAAIGEVVTR